MCTFALYYDTKTVKTKINRPNLYNIPTIGEPKIVNTKTAKGKSIESIIKNKNKKQAGKD